MQHCKLQERKMKELQEALFQQRLKIGRNSPRPRSAPGQKGDHPAPIKPAAAAFTPTQNTTFVWGSLVGHKLTILHGEINMFPYLGDAEAASFAKQLAGCHLLILFHCCLFTLKYRGGGGGSFLSGPPEATNPSLTGWSWD